jgi:hypothetical protein
MILPVASHILRRLQNTIYPPQPPEEMQETATIENGNGSIPTMEIDHDPTFDSRSLDVANFNFSRRMNSNASSSSLPEEPSTYILTPQHWLSPSHDTTSARETPSTHTRSRQSSNPLTCTPDVNAQTVLRKRILEIQSLNIAEREKARLVQVVPHFLMFT